MIVLKGLLFLASGIGIAFLVLCVWTVSHIPKASAMPNTFIIVETYGASNVETPLAKIYLESPSAAADLIFEGASLKYQFREVSHQQAAVPLNGVVVTGSGAILFGATQIKVDDGRVTINGRPLSACQSGSVLLGTPSFEIRGTYNRPGPLEITLGKNGWYFEGYIHLGGRHLFTASLYGQVADRLNPQEGVAHPL